jgi:hypothetical protein
MFRYAVLLILTIPLFSCEKEMPHEIIPYAFVSQEINIKLIQNQPLQNIGGYIYVEPGEGSGFKGLIIYHEGNGVYKTFERACSFDPYADCEAVKVDDSGLFLKHECCNSTFDFQGHPTGGAASLELVQYLTYLDGNYLIIKN